MIRYPVLVVMGLISAPLMEIMGMLWMQLLPAGIDLTANYFTAVVLPVALCLHFLMAVILWKAFEPAPKSGGAVYLGTHMAAQAVMLNGLLNPPADIAVFLAILLFSGTLMIFVFNRYFWCPQCAGAA
jgi:hypothetical protein